MSLSLGKIIGLIVGICKQTYGEGQKLSIKIVDQLPDVGESSNIYLIPKNPPEENNLFDEYLYVNGNWEPIGEVGIDFQIDNELSKGSTNPVQNKVITEALELKASTEYVDSIVGDIGEVLDNINGEIIN